MKSFKRPAIYGLLWLAFSAAAYATPFTIATWNEPIEDGGGFSAYLNGNSSQSFEVFCADYRNYVDAPNDNYNVNISGLSNISDTRYGTTPESSFTTQTVDGYSLVSADNRYLLAGWLTTQYDSNFSGSRDIGIQNAIWTLLDVDGSVHNDGAETTWIQNAVLWEQNNPGQVAALASEVRIYTSTDVASDTNLNLDCTTNRYSVGEQEMINVVPEPGVFMLLGSGLVVLGLMRKRKSA